MRFRSLVAIFLLALASCINDKDYALDELTLTPTLAFPLAHGNVTILDLLTEKDSAYLKVYPDGLLYFSYTQSLPTQDAQVVRNLFKIPNNVSNFGFDVVPYGTLPPIPNDVLLISSNQTIDLNLSPEQLSEMLLKSGTLDYSIGLSQPTSPINALPYEITVTLTDVVDKNTGIPLSFTAGPGAGSRSLVNYIMKMNKNKFAIKLDFTLKKRTSPVFVAGGTKANITLSLNGLDFAYIKGFLGDRTATIPPQTIDITIFNSSLKKSKISFVQPVIKMSVLDEYGVPCEVSFSKLEAQKTGATLPFQISPASPIALNYPATMGTSATTTVAVNNAGSILDFGPTQLAFAATARINKGLATGSNFIEDAARLQVTLQAEVPLYGQASGVTLADTLAIDLSNVTQSTVLSASLRIKSINELPLDANIQMYLMDKNHVILDSIFTSNQTYMVKASSVTSSGELQTAGSSDLKLDLAIDKLNKIFSSQYILVRSKLNTTRDANGTLLNVKFKAAYKLNINIGLLAKMSIKAK